MKYLANLKQPLLNAHGDRYNDEKSGAGYILVEVLSGMSQCSGNEKIEAYRLSLALIDADDFEMEESDIKLCKKAMDESGLPANVYAQVTKVLEGSPKPAQEEPKTTEVAPAQPQEQTPAPEPQPEPAQ